MEAAAAGKDRNGRRAGQPVQLRRWVWFNVDKDVAAPRVINTVGEALHGARNEIVAFQVIVEADARVTGIELGDGTRHDADVVVVAAGAWTPRIVPGMREHLRTTGQPVFHLAVPPAPADGDFGPTRFPVFATRSTSAGEAANSDRFGYICFVRRWRASNFAIAWSYALL